MKVSLSWLKEYAPLKVNIHQLADRLTMTLTEVEEIVSLDALKDITVGEVLEVNPHPNADNIRLTKVKIGNGIRDIVCGAPNVEAGQKVAVALPGVTLPDGLTIEQRRIRGELSDGMICSPRELGVSDDHEGIWVLPADAKVGASLPSAVKGDHDTFELDVLANRPDCLGHLGVAREAAAACQVSFAEPKLKTLDKVKAGPIKGALDTKKLATRLSLGGIKGLQNTESPAWLQKRLVAVGQRPINAIVDVTNYVMLEYGQPLHAYDAGKLPGQDIGVRLAKKGEGLRTLDGKQRSLDAETLVITSGNQPVGIAGIMGGADTEVDDATTEIVLECANFDAAQTRRTARRLGLRTEASARFEKGISAETTWPAIRRALDLIKEVCGGELTQLTDVRAATPKPKALTVSLAALNDFIGSKTTRAQAAASLKRLGFAVAGSGDTLKVTVPYWRQDVTEAVDIYEEVARLEGFDSFPATLPKAQLAVPTIPAEHRLADRLTDALVSAGYTEIMTHSLQGIPLLEKGGYPTDSLVTMANPLSEDHHALRPSMQPRHLEAVTDNLRWRDHLAFFEIGTIFAPGNPDISEQRELLVTLADARDQDLFSDIRGVLDYLLRTLRLDPAELTFEASTGKAAYADGRNFAIQYAGASVGHISQLADPKRWKAGTVCFLTLKLPVLLKVVPERWQALDPPQYPAVWRDLSAFVPEDASFAQLRATIVAAKPEHLVSIGVPSEYRKGGRRSITVPLEFRAERTLTDAEVNAAMAAVEQAVTKTGAEIR